MIDPRLNLFWSYSVPDHGVADSGLGTHEDNLTRGLVVTLRMLGHDATTAFMQQILAVEGAASWRYHLHRSAPKGTEEKGFLLGIHAEGGAAGPRDPDAVRRVPDAVIQAPGRYYVLVEAKKQGEFDAAQLSGHFKTLGEDVAADDVSIHPRWKKITWQQVTEILRTLDGAAGGKLVAAEFIEYLRLQGLAGREFDAELLEVHAKLWQETQLDGVRQRKHAFDDARALVAAQLDRLAVETGGTAVWDAPKDAAGATPAESKGRFYNISRGDRCDVSIRRRAQQGDPKVPGALAAWANGYAGAPLLWGLSWYAKAKELSNLPFGGNVATSIVCTMDQDELRVWERDFDDDARGFAKLAHAMAAGRNPLIRRLGAIADLNEDDAASRVKLTTTPISMHPSKYLWQGAQVDAGAEISLDAGRDIEGTVRALFVRPSAETFPSKGASPSEGFAEWRKGHRYQKAALSLRIRMDGLLTGLPHAKQIERFEQLREALVDAMRVPVG